MSALSRAESLSWRIKDSGDPTRPGFAYLLLDGNQVVGGQENLPALLDYLSLDAEGCLQLASTASRRSLDDARSSPRTMPASDWKAPFRRASG